MGFLEILTIVFVILKATHELNWSWWLVFTPEMISVGIWLPVLLGVAGFGRKALR